MHLIQNHKISNIKAPEQAFYCNWIFTLLYNLNKKKERANIKMHRKRYKWSNDNRHDEIFLLTIEGADNYHSNIGKW